MADGSAEDDDRRAAQARAARHRCAAGSALRSPYVLIGALTNRKSVARAVRGLIAEGVAERCTIVACGERWTSVSDEPDSLRPSIEDLIAAGGIVAALSGLRTSPEAEVAAATFVANEHRIRDVLRGCVSGRELIAGGFPDDVELAAAIDSVAAVPCWRPSNPTREFTAFSVPTIPAQDARQRAE